MPTAASLIDTLCLAPHPEGGWYRRIYTAALTCRPAGYPGERPLATVIVYLLTGATFSAFHRLRSDELWTLLSGTMDVRVHRLQAAAPATSGTLTAETPTQVIPGGTWFAAEPVDGAADDWALLQCTVTPGFDFADFEMGRAAALAADYPRDRALIQRLTRAEGDTG